jgi:valyl-tRNA synthetase
MKQLKEGQYNFKETEEKILKFWGSKKFFKPEFNPKTGEVNSLEEMKADTRESWSLICPPPNAYDRPHIGNLSGYAYQDALARFNRLKGKKVLMVPGKDHAGLEGEATFVRDVLEKEGKRKSEYSREDFYNRVWEHQQKFIDLIRADEKAIGLSADFDRELYTLDDKIVGTVLDTFIKMYKDGLIYKGVRIVNWDVKAQSTIPDNQCERKEAEGTLYYIKYQFEEDSSKFLTVATTRPETMLGDTALVVHPNDERYKDFVGKKVIIPLANRAIPVITNGRIEKEFGTGVLKCTPAHAAEDYEIMLEWNAEQLKIKNEKLKIEEHDRPAVIDNAKEFEPELIGYINVIDKNLRLVGPIPEQYKGLKVNAARIQIAEDLKAAGFLEKEEKITQNLLISERTGVVVEPLMTSQWFMDVSGLKKPLREMVEKEMVKIHPKNLEKKFFSWVDNMRDWAISRNLWWGYRLPVWYNGEIVEEINSDGLVELKLRKPNLSFRTERSEDPESGSSELEKAQGGAKDQILNQVQDDREVGLMDFDPSNPDHMRVQLDSPGEGWIQDDDILDTWFSSGQWPYAVLEAFGLMDTFYPTNALVSATDLLVKWDLTMMLFSHYSTGKQPFDHLFLTGLVKGTDGQKMSKSKKNYIPMDDTREQYGIDSFRMNCFYQNKAGSAYAITGDTLKNFRNFNNKIWNASKFVMMNLEDFPQTEVFAEVDRAQTAENLKLKVKSKKLKVEKEDLAMLDHLIEMETSWNEGFEKYRFGLITEKLYESFWHEFCDKYIETTKSRVWKNKESGEYTSTPESRYAAQAVLYYGLKTYLKMLHPFIPFVTEEIWQNLVEDGKYELPIMYS